MVHLYLNFVHPIETLWNYKTRRLFVEEILLWELWLIFFQLMEGIIVLCEQRNGLTKNLKFLNISRRLPKINYVLLILLIKYGCDNTLHDYVR